MELLGSEMESTVDGRLPCKAAFTTILMELDMEQTPYL